MEFAIIAPVLFLLLFGIFEVGRMIYVYAAVTNASREAVRFGSAVGYDDYGEIKYKHCDAIREMARRSAYFLNLQDTDVTITYDKGPGTAVFHTCTGSVDPGYFLNSGDRILITVTAHYSPYTRLVPWGPRNFVSNSARTILGFVQVAAVYTNTPLPTDTAVPPTFPAPAPSDTPTATPTETPTPTAAWVVTNTPFETQLPVNTATSVNTPTPADTATAIPTSYP